MVGAEKAEGRRRGVKESAEGGTRTRTGLRPLRPERSASTSSTTSARAQSYRPGEAESTRGAGRRLLRVDPPEVVAYPLLRNAHVSRETSPPDERKHSV